MKSDRRQRTADLNKAVKTFILAHRGKPIRINNQPRTDRKTNKVYFPADTPIGCSDWIALMPGGVTLFIEVKVDSDKQRDTQAKFQREVHDLGFVYIIVHDTIDSLVEAIEILEQHTAPTEMLGDAQGRDAVKK